MATRKTMKYMRKTMKKMRGKQSRRIQSRRKNKITKRKNKITKRKMRGGEVNLPVRINEYSKDITTNAKENLLETCLKACQILQPFVQIVYELLNFKHMTKGSQLHNKYNYDQIKDPHELFATKKNINDVFTITDGMVQHILRTYLFNNPDNFVGEENITVTKDNNNGNYTLTQGSEPESKREIKINPIFTEIINEAIKNIEDLADTTAIDKDFLQNYTIFVDPIDGTAEYQGTDKKSKTDITDEITQKGEQATIMIGFADINTGHPVGGIIFRPVKNEKKPLQAGTYAYGWVDTDIYQAKLDDIKTEEKGKIRFLTSNGDISPATETLIQNIGGERIGSGGAGNKILMLLENKGDVYLQDRGVSRWDTCAGEAILRAKGGLLCKLTEFETTGKTDSRYTYKKVDVNPDPNEAASKIDQNSIISDSSKDELNNLKEEKELLEENKDLKKVEIKKIKKQINELIETNFIKFNPTNNLCGLVAITGEKKYLLDEIYNAIQELKATTGLKFDYN